MESGNVSMNSKFTAITKEKPISSSLPELKGKEKISKTKAPPEIKETKLLDKEEPVKKSKEIATEILEKNPEMKAQYEQQKNHAILPIKRFN